MKHELAKATESGSVVTAVKHPTEDGLILPLWAIPVWDLIAVASQEHMLWQHADVWLRPGTHWPEDQALMERVRGLMGQIPWVAAGWLGWEVTSRLPCKVPFLQMAQRAEHGHNGCLL